jgi:flavin reductase (DIM6/NTAB) family NADH-FMN oxidoreductase RutF
MKQTQSSEAFRRACSRFATGVAIATLRDAHGVPHGLTVNSFTSVSLEPALVLVSIAHSASVIDAFRAARHFAVNVLHQDQQALSNRFASRDTNRFDGLAWTPAPSGSPLLEGALAWFECRTFRALEAGDHTLFLGQVEELEVHDGLPLLYFASSYRRIQE